MDIITYHFCYTEFTTILVLVYTFIVTYELILFSVDFFWLSYVMSDNNNYVLKNRLLDKTHLVLLSHLSLFTFFDVLCNKM